MKVRKFVNGITFFTTPQMYHAIKKVTDERQISISDFLRSAIARYLELCKDDDLAEDHLLPLRSSGEEKQWSS